MKRTATAVTAAGLIAVMLPFGAAGQTELHVSDDGLFTAAFPPGTVPPNTLVDITLRSADQLPGDELTGLEIRSGFYDVDAGGVPFAAPARVTRTVQLDEIGFDPATDGVPLIPLAGREPDGSWTWLDDQVIAFDRGSGNMTVSGSVAQPGPVLGFGGAAFVDPNPMVNTADHTVRFVPELTQPAGLDAVSGPPIGTSFHPGVSTPDPASADSASATFDCLFPAQAPVSVRLPIDGIGEGLPLFDDLGLGPASLDVLITGTVDCPAADPMAGSWPKTIRGSAKFTSLLPNGIDYEEVVRFLRNREKDAYDRMRMRQDQDVRLIRAGDDGVAWFFGRGPGYQEVYGLREGNRPGIVEGISAGGTPELFDDAASLREALRAGVDGNRIIDRAVDGRPMRDAIIRDLNGQPREMGFQHAVRIKLDTDAEHPADVILGVADTPTAEQPPGPSAYVSSFDPDAARWQAVALPGQDPLPAFEFGDAGALPLVGDFDGDGTPGPATYEPDSGRLIIRDFFQPGPADRKVALGETGGLPLVGDFDGDGIDDIGLWLPDESVFAAFGLSRSGSGADTSGDDIDPLFRFLFDADEFDFDDELIVSDFDGDGTATLGVRRGDMLHWTDSLDDLSFDDGQIDLGPLLIDDFGLDSLLIADWDATGQATPGVFDRDARTLRTSLTDEDFSGIDGIADTLIFADGFESGDTSAWSN